jgi:hypothetical protein
MHTSGRQRQQNPSFLEAAASVSRADRAAVPLGEVLVIGSEKNRQKSALFTKALYSLHIKCTYQYRMGAGGRINTCKYAATPTSVRNRTAKQFSGFTPRTKT